MKKYRIAQAGCGARGKIHIKGFVENPDCFEIVGLCDLNEAKMKEAAEKFGVKAAMYTDVEQMLKDTRPDVFCFVTYPDIRLSFIELGVKYGVKGMAFEKPMATSLADAKLITDLCNQSGIKAIVCHQHKYLPSMVKLKAIVDSGDIGKIEKIHVGTRAWLSQLGTHYMDYALWVNGGKKAKWAVGHVNGRNKLTDSHPSPDFVNGTILLEDGVRLYFECGYLSEQNLSDNNFWVDDRLTVYGTHGNAWAECNGAWAAFTKSTAGKLKIGQEDDWIKQNPIIQAPYIRELAEWLDNDEKIHPCNINISYHGFEILEGLCLSALDNRRIDFPITELEYEDVLKRMERELP